MSKKRNQNEKAVMKCTGVSESVKSYLIVAEVKLRHQLVAERRKRWRRTTCKRFYE
jgi:hypothetical protein